MTKTLAVLVCALTLFPAAAQAKTFTPISTSPFKLVKHGFNKTNRSRITQLSKTYPQVGLGTLVADTNRTNEPLMADRAPAGAFGYSWQSSGSQGGDNGVSYWTPQGITGNGQGVQAQSWYKGSSGHEEGVRVSFVDRSKGAHGKYRFGLLVKPTGGSGFAQIQRHAGGIAWYGKYLYVADTNNGLLVFDLSRTLRVPDNRLGSTGNYRYLIPQIGRYQRAGPGNLKFSALSLDAGGPALVAGEYQVYEHHDPTTRIARWALSPKTGRLVRAQASQAWRTGFDQLQGVVTHKGQIYVSSTQGAGFLYHGKPKKKARVNRWGDGPEGLYATKTQLWTLTEARFHRTVFGKTFKSLN